MSDEPLPLGTLSPEQIAAAKASAAALDLEAIERRHAEWAALTYPEDEGGYDAHADRGVLLAALREARAEVKRLRTGLDQLKSLYQSADAVLRAESDEADRLRREVERLQGVDRAAREMIGRALGWKPGGATWEKLTYMLEAELDEAAQAQRERDEARAEVERLRGALSRLADEYQHAGPVNGFVVARRLRLVAADMDRPAGTLASLDDACDGSDR